MKTPPPLPSPPRASLTESDMIMAVRNCMQQCGFEHIATHVSRALLTSESAFSWFVQAKDGKNKIERAERAIRMIAVRLLHGNARRFIEDDPALPGMEFDPEMMVFTTLRTLAHEAAPNDRAAVFAELYATILCLIRETSCKSSRMRFAWFVSEQIILNLAKATTGQVNWLMKE